MDQPNPAYAKSWRHLLLEFDGQWGSTLQLRPMRPNSMDLTPCLTPPRSGPRMLSPNANSSNGSLFKTEFSPRIGLPLMDGRMTLCASFVSRLRKQRRIFARTIHSLLLFGTTWVPGRERFYMFPTSCRSLAVYLTSETTSLIRHQMRSESTGAVGWSTPCGMEGEEQVYFHWHPHDSPWGGHVSSRGHKAISCGRLAAPCPPWESIKSF